MSTFTFAVRDRHLARLGLAAGDGSIMTEVLFPTAKCPCLPADSTLDLPRCGLNAFYKLCRLSGLASCHYRVLFGFL